MNQVSESRTLASELTATPGRVVYVYGLGNKAPHIPAPAIVTAVALDGAVDVQVLGSPRIHGYSRNDLFKITLHDPLSAEKRAELHAADPNKPWAEWIPYQKGQAAKSDELVTTMTQTLRDQQARIANLEKNVFGPHPVATSEPSEPPATKRK